MNDINKCDICTTGSTYFEAPCIFCNNNPKEREELLKEVTKLIKSRDNCTNKRTIFSGNTAPCAYCKGEKMIDLITDKGIEKEVINVKTSNYRYCPACGRKLGYDL